MPNAKIDNAAVKTWWIAFHDDEDITHYGCIPVGDYLTGAKYDLETFADRDSFETRLGELSITINEEDYL